MKSSTARSFVAIALFGYILINKLSNNTYAALLYKFPTNVAGLQVEGEVVKNACKQYITIASSVPFEKETRQFFAIRLPVKKTMTLTLGRGLESLTIANQGGFFTWRYTSPDGKTPQMRPYPGGTSQTPISYWWENSAYTPKGRLKPSFSLPTHLSNWNAYFQAQQNCVLEKEWWPVAVEMSGSKVRYYFDDILLHDQAATEDAAGRKLQIILPPGSELRPLQATSLGKPVGGFYTVNLANRYNCPGASDFQRTGRFEREGIPFEAAPARNNGNNCVDLGVSWFREGNLDSGDGPNHGVFGGRWAGALSANPTRVQFRVPNAAYNALYLLVSCEERPDRTRRLTAQFYRPGSGFPQNFVSDEIPAAEGIQLVRIPIRPDALLQFADREVLELELAGDVRIYRASPDPLHYSMHCGGPPPGIKVYAMTLAKAQVEVDFQPEAFGNIWVGNMKPSYKVVLRNCSNVKQELNLTLKTASYDGKETTSQAQRLPLAPGKEATTRFDLVLTKFGWHKAVLTVNGESYERSLAILRQREYARRPFDVKGFMFGIWAPGRTHYMPSNYDVFRLAGPLGIESVSHSAWLIDDPEILSLKYGLKNFMTAKTGVRPASIDVADIEEKLRDTRITPSDVNEPVFQYLFAEPGGIGTGGGLPEFYGEPPRARTPEEEARFQEYKRMVVNFSKAFRKVFPKQKILMPWGDPCFAIPFLEDAETREAFDGIGFDAAFFDRLPEMQMHQGSLHGMMLQFLFYWNKYRKAPPLIVTVEGPCLGGVKPGALTADQQAAHLPRAMLVLAGYGVNRFFASVGVGPECSSYWGEQHYGGGVFTRVTLNPYPAYATQGTLIRHLRHMEFVKDVPTGSLSTYCMQFKDSRNGELLHVLWTIRGSRPVKLKSSRIFDSMDNLVTTPLALGQLPVYVYGCDGVVELGEPDHGDVSLADNHVEMGNVADLFTGQTNAADDEYLNSFPKAIRRFPATMMLERRDAGLAVALPPQQVDRGVMPFYTVLTPERPIEIPGKAQYLTVEVTAASDWGRIVYVLRDAKGERWISVGTRDTYNNDDTPNAASFNFDGRRLVRFELPSNLPWDNFREMGSTWWGAYGGDKVVDLPLAIDKICIERRAQAIYVNRLVPTPPTPVILGKLYAEYASADLKTYAPPPIAMPAPPAVAAPYNPILELAASATLPATIIEKVVEPDHYYDGTRAHFHFREADGAVTYDVFLSMTPDGANAIKLGAGLKASGALVSGFLANTDFYAFVVYYDAAGANSAPSPAFKLNMQDKFANK